jgi:hypothetical protein
MGENGQGRMTEKGKTASDDAALMWLFEDWLRRRASASTHLSEWEARNPDYDEPADAARQIALSTCMEGAADAVLASTPHTPQGVAAILAVIATSLMEQIEVLEPREAAKYAPALDAAIGRLAVAGAAPAPVSVGVAPVGVSAFDAAAALLDSEAEAAMATIPAPAKPTAVLAEAAATRCGMAMDVAHRVWSFLFGARTRVPEGR